MSFTIAMGQMQRQLAAIAAKDLNIQSIVSSVGSGGGPRTGTNTGTMLLKLQPRGNRDLSADEIIQELRPKLATVPGINAFMQNPPAIRVGGMSSKSSFQYTLQDTNQDELDSSALKLRAGVLQHAHTVSPTSRDGHHHGPQQPGGECRYRPRPGGGARRLHPVD